MTEPLRHPSDSTPLQLLRQGPIFDPKPRVQLLGDEAALDEVLAAADLLDRDFGVFADVWRVASHGAPRPDASLVQRQLARFAGPLVVAATDGEAADADRIRAFVTDRRLIVLGLEVNRHQIAIAALEALVADGTLPPEEVTQALVRYGVDAESRSPALRPS